MANKKINKQNSRVQSDWRPLKTLYIHHINKRVGLCRQQSRSASASGNVNKLLFREVTCRHLRLSDMDD